MHVSVVTEHRVVTYLMLYLILGVLHTALLHDQDRLQDIPRYVL
jgi:hypothetical protein